MPDRGQVPEAWREALAAELEAGEEVLAWFEPDLDARLHYARALVVLTGRRVLSAEAGRWQSWLLLGLTARTVDHGGAGAVELLNSSGRLAEWRYTAGRATDAQRLTA